MTARLTADFWISAYLSRLSAQGIYAHISARGDATAGAILIKIALMNGFASLIGRRTDAEGRDIWFEMLANRPEADVDAAIARQRGFDRDLWVIEVEDPRGRHLLDLSE